MGNPGGSLGGDWEGEEGGDADRRPVGREERGGVRAAKGWIQGEGGWGPPLLGSEGGRSWAAASWEPVSHHWS